MLENRRRWVAFYVVCLGTLMVVLDTTIVNVALPSIRSSLGFSQTSLAWVVNAYMLTFGGCLLLCGRLGDLYGQRRVFVAGITLFTVASIGCGLSQTQTMLIAFRAIQGVGGSMASAVGFALVVRLFTNPHERAKAMGITGFVASGGGALGVLLGGVLTDVLNWHWIFLVNVPIGIAVVILMRRLVDESTEIAAPHRVDFVGAVTITGSLMLAVDAVVNGNQAGWTSTRTLTLLGIAAALLVTFLVVEAKSRAPLMRLGLFRSRNVATSNVVGVLWAAAMFAWFFLSALYLQLVLGYSALQVGLAFLPGNVVMAVCSVSVSARLVMRFGYRRPLAVGLGLAAVGLGLLARAPVDGAFAVDVLPSMVLLGIGAGIAFNPVLLAAMSDVDPTESGFASGMVNTSFMMGGALGLAVLASLAASASGADPGPADLLAGYHVAFAVSATLAAVAGLVGYLGIRQTADADIAPVDEFRADEAVAAV